MSDPSSIDPSLRDAALRSFRDSLSKAQKEEEVNQAEVDRVVRELKSAREKLDLSTKDCKAFSDLIDVYSLTQTQYIQKQFEGVFTDLQSDLEELDDDDSEEEETGNEDGQVRKRRGRLHARPKTLEIIRERNRFVTVDQVIELVKQVYEEGVIKDKTIKNAVWDLTASDELKKHYDRKIREYIYGLPTWFDGDEPKGEFWDTSFQTERPDAVFLEQELVPVRRKLSAEDSAWIQSGSDEYQNELEQDQEKHY